ncbi:MAG: T9SS type A sorting domain-containing protein [Bacteroidales bacterium]|nr:T9SS type A sorting domain-containing protein [Bacteroidales bacterium]
MKKLILITAALFTLLSYSEAQIDTSGFAGWTPQYNSMTTWDNSAFEQNALGHPDYGWGIYNTITHGLAGDSIFAIKLQNGDVKQILIEEKNSVGNIYTFRYADLNGQNQYVEKAYCVNNTDKLFLYYSIQNHEFVDHEPVKTAWDMVLTKYTDTDIKYTVTGFLQNEGNTVSVLHAADATAAANSGIADTTEFSANMNAIGNSWYKLSGMSIIPLDTMVYFVKTADKSVYKMQVNFFESGFSGLGRVGIQTQQLLPTTGDVVKDTLVMGSGYANDVYYSMMNRIVKESPRASWDIAFKTNAFSSSIFTNSTMGIGLFTSHASVDAWTSLSAPVIRMEALNIYPNPVKDMVRISNSSWKDNAEFSLSVYNMAGKLVYSQLGALQGNSVDANLGEMENGLYQMRILIDGGYYSGKILVSK